METPHPALTANPLTDLEDENALETLRMEDSLVKGAEDAVNLSKSLRISSSQEIITNKMKKRKLRMLLTFRNQCSWLRQLPNHIQQPRQSSYKISKFDTLRRDGGGVGGGGGSGIQKRDQHWEWEGRRGRSG